MKGFFSYLVNFVLKTEDLGYPMRIAINGNHLIQY